MPDEFVAGASRGAGFTCRGKLTKARLNKDVKSLNCSENYVTGFFTLARDGVE